MEPPHLPISQGKASVLLVAYGLFYVLPLYSSPATRPSPTLTRDAPQVIRARIRVTILSTSSCSLLTLLLLLTTTDYSRTESLHAMGYWPIGLAETWNSLLLTICLFAAPLYEALVVEGVWRDWLRLRPLANLWQDMMLWRNIVAGPVTEEVMFRSASVPILLSAGTSLRSLVFLSPLVFGMAHIHHFYEFRITRPHVPIAMAIVSAVIQFSYTSLFGTYATFIYLRTGSLLAVVAVHAFCNSLGLPRFWGHVEPYWSRDAFGNPLPSGGRPWFWTVVYYMLLVTGAVGWWTNIYSMTESKNALALGDM